MITCPVCGAANHHLADTCASCRGFLQTRVENLDLFATFGSLIEHPHRTFHLIGVARHKNYAIMISALAGWPVAFTLFWALKAGEHAASFLEILVAGIAVGPFVGVVLCFLLVLLVKLLSRPFRVAVTFRNLFACVAYGLMPLIFVLLFLLPIVFLTFGLYFFTRAPSPDILRPFSFYAIAVLAGGFYAWSLFLLVAGVRKIGGAGWLRSSALLVTALVVISSALYCAARWLA